MKLQKNYFAIVSRLAVQGLAWVAVDQISQYIFKNEQKKIANPIIEDDTFNEFRNLKEFKDIEQNQQLLMNFLYGSFIVNFGKGIYRTQLLKKSFLNKVLISAPASVFGYYAFCSLYQQRSFCQNIENDFLVLVAAKIILSYIQETQSTYIRQNIMPALKQLDHGKVNQEMVKRMKIFGAVDGIVRFTWMLILVSKYNQRHF